MNVASDLQLFTYVSDELENYSEMLKVETILERK